LRSIPFTSPIITILHFGGGSPQPQPTQPPCSHFTSSRPISSSQLRGMRDFSPSTHQMKHRMKVGKDVQDHQVQPPNPFPLTMSLSATSPQFLNTCREGNSIASLGSLFQCLVTLSGNKLIYIQLDPFPGTTEGHYKSYTGPGCIVPPKTAKKEVSLCRKDPLPHLQKQLKGKFLAQQLPGHAGEVVCAVSPGQENAAAFWFSLHQLPMAGIAPGLSCREAKP